MSIGKVYICIQTFNHFEKWRKYIKYLLILETLTSCSKEINVCVYKAQVK